MNQENSKQPDTGRVSAERATDEQGSELNKKPFVKPELRRHEKLPEVTTGGFFVTFQP